MFRISLRERLVFALRSRLKYKLIVICFLVFALQCGIILFSYRNVADHNKVEMIDQNLKLLNQANQNYFSNVIQEIDRLMQRAFVESIFWEDNALQDQSQDYIGENAKINEILSNIYSYGNDTDSVYLYFNRNHRLYIMDELSHKDIPSAAGTNNTFTVREPDLSRYAWYVGAMRSKGTLYLSENASIRETRDAAGRKLLSFSKALYNPLQNKELICVISINISYRFFEELARQLCKPEEKLMVLSADGTVIFSTVPDEIFRRPGGTLLARLNADASGYADIPSRHSVLLYNQSATTGWYMVKEIPNRVLMEDVRQTATTNLILLLCTFVISIVLMLFVALRITNPIKEIAHAMAKFEEGDGKFQAYLDRIDEIGMLNRSFNKMKERIHNLIHSEYKAKINEKQARLEALQAQINPHFLNNTLQIVSGIAIENRIDSIEKISSALSTILRYSLSRNNELVTLEQELHNVEQYLFIQRYRYEDRLESRVHIDPAILNCHVPVLTLQPLVENAIKHGMERKMGKGLITIRSEIGKTEVLLHVEDDGIGVSAEEAARLNRSFTGEERGEKSGWDGRGLLNIHDRIRYYFGDPFGLRVESREGEGFRVTVRLPRTEDSSSALTQRGGNGHVPDGADRG